MMGIGFPELMIILVIIMIIFGAGKLPEIGSAFGNSIKNFKKSMKEAEEIQEATNLESTETSEGSDDSEPSEGETTKEPAPAEDTKEN
jgi:sec-independent protein translocase protein TatA